MARDQVKITRNRFPYGSPNSNEIVASGSVSFSGTDDLTVEKRTNAISFNGIPHQDNKFLIALEKPVEDTAGDMTCTVYNRININGNTRDIPYITIIVPANAGVDTYKAVVAEGLFLGEGQIILGFKFASDSTGGITVSYKIISY